MKVSGQVILTVNGRELIFSEQELIAILEEHFYKEVPKQATTIKLGHVPTEGKWFEVNPQAIDRSLFQRERGDRNQEEMRKLILEAFAEVDKYSEQYVSPFYTLIPENRWYCYKTVKQLEEYAKRLGSQMADWVEQSLEWAQRICNGESWEAVCNIRDTAKYRRLVVWKNGYTHLVGGSSENHDCKPASYVCNRDYFSDSNIDNAVPLVVFYEK